MTPDETGLLVAGWNEAQRGSMPAAPTLDEYEALVARYG